MNDQPACSHLSVKRFTVGNECRTFKEEWRCEDCGLQFFSMLLDFAPGKIQIAEPYATLRDQFAMAAMQGILASCHGPAWGKDVFPIGESAYAYADLMMKARNQ